MTDAERRIESYLLTQLGDEICEHERTMVDERTKFAYDRMRELYWTVSRVGRNIRALFERPASAPVERSPLQRASLDRDIPAPRSDRRLLIDITPTHRRDLGTGIQRVVREVAKAAVESGEGLPVFMQNGQLYSHFAHSSLPEKVEACESDRYLMLDAAWAHADEYRKMMETVSRRGGTNIVCVYDLLPLRYPATCPPALHRAFELWFDELVCRSDAAVAISRTVASELRDYAAAHGRRHDRPVGWWLLGADFGGDAQVSPSLRTASICSSARPFFLSVGTLAPTKGQAVSLTAFEKLWDAGVDAAFVIIGKRSWNTKALEKRLEEHREFGQRLIWLRDADDAELRGLYRSARGVVCSSFTEGFGLPLVEAAHHGAPIIASDIPIFRELGGDGIVYFDMLDPGALARAIEQALALPKSAPKLSAPTWGESTHALIQLIDKDAYQFR